MRNAPDPQKIFHAIEIMAGSTDMNPELTRRVKYLEGEIKKSFILVQEMRFIVKRTLDQDGDLNVT
jgi:hypothetical protein